MVGGLFENSVSVMVYRNGIWIPFDVPAPLVVHGFETLPSPTPPSSQQFLVELIIALGFLVLMLGIVWIVGIVGILHGQQKTREIDYVQIQPSSEFPTFTPDFDKESKK